MIINSGNLSLRRFFSRMCSLLTLLLFSLPLNAFGETVESEFKVNTYTNYYQIQSSVTMDTNGNFVVVWTDVGVDGGNGQDGSGAGVFGQRFTFNAPTPPDTSGNSCSPTGSGGGDGGGDSGGESGTGGDEPVVGLDEYVEIKGGGGVIKGVPKPDTPGGNLSGQKAYRINFGYEELKPIFL